MCTRLKKSKVSTKSTSNGDDNKMNIFSMIKFYESIPDYDALRHLSCYDFLDRLNNMKSVHMNLANNIEPNGKAILQRPRSVSVKGRRKLVRGKKCNSASKISSRKICQFDNIKHKSIFDVPPQPPDSGLKRCSTSNSSNVSKSCTSIQEKLLLEDVDHDGHQSNRITPSPVYRSPIYRPTSNYDHDRNRKIGLCDVRSANAQPRFDEETNDHLHYRSSNNFNRHYHYNYHPHQTYRDYLHYHEHERPENHFKTEPPMQTPSPHEKRHHTIEETAQQPILTCRHKIKRARSCPKDWISNCFPSSHPASESSLKNDEQKVDKQFELINGKQTETVKRTGARDLKLKKGSAAKIRNKILLKATTIGERKSPSSSADEFHTQMVRTNLAANLRHQWSRQKITQMSNEKITSVASFIPKCHRWDVRKSPAWQSFNMEDTTTEKFIREMARKEEQKLRQQSHLVHMSRMRQRVKSAQLLLEGRALGSK